MRFEGKTVLVTGGAGSIGYAAARRFSQEGAQVVLADLNEAQATKLASELPGKAIATAADVTSEEGVQTALNATLAAFDRLDVVFNNAGISGAVMPVHELPVQEWDHIIRTNLRSQFIVLQACARVMIASSRPGAIVNMGSSMGGWDVLSGGAGYTASKHAVTGLTKTAALDLAGYGIRVNAICPGVIETSLGVPAAGRQEHLDAVHKFADRIPLRRIGQPEDVAAAVAFLASEDARHITGVDWLIDGGQTLQSWANAPNAARFPRHLED